MDSSLALDKVALALSDPLRLKILDLLAQGRNDPCWSPDIPELPTAMCALDLQHMLGETSASKLSYHMRVLRDAGLVREHKQGKWVYYLVDEGTLAAFLDQVHARYIA